MGVGKQKRDSLQGAYDKPGYRDTGKMPGLFSHINTFQRHRPHLQGKLVAVPYKQMLLIRATCVAPEPSLLCGHSNTSMACEHVSNADSRPYSHLHPHPSRHPESESALQIQMP